MSQVACVHCQKPIHANAKRSGNFVTCPSCSAKVYMPQVRHVPTAEDRRKASAAAAAAAGPAKKGGYQPSRKGGMVSSNGVGVTMIILGVLVFGGLGLAVGGFFVYQSVKGHMDVRKGFAQADYNFRGTNDAADSSAPKPAGAAPGDGGAGSAPSSTTAGMGGVSGPHDAAKPTKNDMEKIRKSFQAYLEASERVEEDYREDLAKVGLDQLLAAGRISADQDFKQSRGIILATRQTIDKHRQIAVEEDNAFITDLGKLKLEGVPTEVMVRRIKGVIDVFQPKTDQIRSIDSAIASQYEQAINHLEATRGAWKLEGEAVVFNESKDAERYKTFFNEVDRYVQMRVSLEENIIKDSIPMWKSIGVLEN